jgi:16S rRNA (uracil1498-N3)-methyltransferase
MTQAKPKIRLFVPLPFTANQPLSLNPNQSHYLSHVMRARAGDTVAVFNGRDGEWAAEVTVIEKKRVTVMPVTQIAPQAGVPDLWLIFAPIKNKTELVVEKAIELGVSKLLTVITRHSVVRSVNLEKLHAHAIEAAEQCGRHDVPAIETYEDIPHLLNAWPKDRILLYADESGEGKAVKTLLASLPVGKYAILIGPEGGFANEEQRILRSMPYVKAFGLGPRILRADTAAVAALACMQAALGDWDVKPAFESNA